MLMMHMVGHNAYQHRADVAARHVCMQPIGDLMKRLGVLCIVSGIQYLSCLFQNFISDTFKIGS